jgi:hypothetical protein
VKIVSNQDEKFALDKNNKSLNNISPALSNKHKKNSINISSKKTANSSL